MGNLIYFLVSDWTSLEKNDKDKGDLNMINKVDLMDIVFRNWRICILFLSLYGLFIKL